MSDQPPAQRPHQFSLKGLMLLFVVIALPLAFLQLRQHREQELAEACQPFQELGAFVHHSPSSTPEPSWTELFHHGRNQVKSISFWEGSLTDQQLQSLHDEMHSLPKLSRLHVNSKKISDAGVECVADLRQLTCLVLNGTTISDVSVKRLALERGNRMQHLALPETSVTDVALEHISQMGQLRYLYLSDTRVTDAGLVHLKANTKLKSLSLRNTAISDLGLSLIADLTNIETLDLGGTQISDEGLDHLLRLKNLRCVVLDGTMVTSNGLRRLQQLRPQISFDPADLID
jgi:Leucine-rich repeat (LRR) protein